MSKHVFEQISAGLQEALSVARGETTPYALHIPAEIDVKAIREKTGLTQKDFASVFAFGFDQLKQWEQGRSRPVKAMRAYLMLIDRKPEMMLRELQEMSEAYHEDDSQDLIAM